MLAHYLFASGVLLLELKGCEALTPKFRVSLALTPSQISRLAGLVFFEAFPVSLASKILRIDNKKHHDYLETEHGKTFFSTSHVEYRGSKSRELWEQVNRLNLINLKAHFKPISRERARCMKRVSKIKGFGYFYKKKPVWLNNYYQQDEIDFLNYKNRVNHKILVFFPDPTKPENFFAPAHNKTCSTRFTDKNIQKATQAKYYSLWDNASLKFDKAIMVTLTTDPKLFDNLWDANIGHMPAVNTLLSFIKSRVESEIKRYPDFKMLNEAVKRGDPLTFKSLSGLRGLYIRRLHEQYQRRYPEVMREEFKASIIDGSLSYSDIKALILEGYKISSHFKNLPDDYVNTYINILEFQFNGRLHSHIVMFGLDYLMDVHELSRKWKDYGRGEIVHTYALKKNPVANTWTWKNPNNTPKDSRNKTPVDYLKEYLLKAQYLAAVNYWVFGSHFYTNSRNFEPFEERIRKAILRKQRRLAPRYWVFAGTIVDYSEQFPNIRYLGIKDYLKLAQILASGNDPPAAVSVS